MAWEKRARGGRYYTRSRRRGDGSLHRQYLGLDTHAQFEAAKDALNRLEREIQRASIHTSILELAAVSVLTDQLCFACQDQVRRELLAEGFHQHHRGEWRKT